MINSEVAFAFERIADLLEITGSDRFRVNSYRRASRSVRDTTEDLAAVAAEGRLAKLPGIGKSIAAKIEQFVETGHIEQLDALSAQLPEGLPGLLDIPGLGPKKVALVHKELGVGSLADLKEVVADSRLEQLPGFGKASAKKVADGIAMLENSAGRTPLGVALPIAQEIAEFLGRLNSVRRIASAGSLRRGAETVGDIDLVCDSDEGEAVVAAFTQLPGVIRVLGSGATKGSITIQGPAGSEVRAQLRVVPGESFGSAIQYFTGSKEHNVRLRELAIKKGWKLNEWGLYDGDKQLAGDKEEGIYTELGLPFPPPELREDRAEFAANFDPANLITVEDIRGDLHMHTVASDGKNTIEEMALAGIERGYAFIAICDHSKSSTIANGLSIDRMEQHIADIRKVDSQIEGIKILVGCECDILSDGTLDYPDELLAECDWVVASCHAAMSGGKVPPTERTILAIENPNVCVIGHPTGRLINRRSPMKIDMAKVVEAAARTGTALEINSSWQRLDLKDLHVRQSLEAGVTLSINTDAHRCAGLAGIGYGVTTARRGGASAKSVLNTWPLEKLVSWVQKKRSEGVSHGNCT